MPLPTVAIVGRPNVGKSTLFNRLVGKRLALVDDRPGVTRDRREGDASLLGLDFRVIDTAGFEDEDPETLPGRMRQQTEAAVRDADAALFLIDSRQGLTPLDEEIGRWLRVETTPVIVVANKAEGSAGESGILEAYRLGLGEPVAISAEHGEGVADLFHALQPLIEREDADEEPADEDAPLKLAIVGRPNAGKSTLVNTMIGEQRMITGPEAGITRDSISIAWEWNGRPVQLVDTAGLRKRAKIEDKLERLSAADTKRALDYAEVVVLLLDATRGLESQDLRIADWQKSATLAFKEDGETLVLLGHSTGHVDQSLWLEVCHGRREGAAPRVDLAVERRLGTLVRDLIGSGKVSAVHDISDGGALVAIAEMALAGGIGVEVKLPTADNPAAILFGEDQGRMLVTTRASESVRAIANAAQLFAIEIGTTGGDAIVIRSGKAGTAQSVSLADLRAAHEGFFPKLMGSELTPEF